ncbi:MAG: hypothetical protein VX016_10455, partial [Verrucomicrobiota bacterium]|nr:hypothetical protein [Verrucomicrobiota bacterium]
ENQDQVNQDQENQDQVNQDQENQDQENQDQENQDQENKKINPETGYSKEQAQRQLEVLANEQLLKALPRRSRARFKKDW